MAIRSVVYFGILTCVTASRALLIGRAKLVPNAPIADTTDPLITPPPRLPASTCTKYNCNLFFEDVSVYGWPDENANTDCQLPSDETNAFPPGLNPVSPSIYAVFSSVKASDGCQQIGKAFESVTLSFAPGELSSIERPGVTKAYNDSDLCPPSGVPTTPHHPYRPIIAPPTALLQLDPSFATCIPIQGQGVDSPIQLLPKRTLPESSMASLLYANSARASPHNFNANSGGKSSQDEEGPPGGVFPEYDHKPAQGIDPAGWRAAVRRDRHLYKKEPSEKTAWMPSKTPPP